jgi:hypothetical protein
MPTVPTVVRWQVQHMTSAIEDFISWAVVLGCERHTLHSSQPLH